MPAREGLVAHIDEAKVLLRSKAREIILLQDDKASPRKSCDQQGQRVPPLPAPEQEQGTGERDPDHRPPIAELRDAERAIVAAGATVPDWSGGTRLGETLKIFLDRWGQRGTARGAVVVVLSDGWERGDAALLGDQVARLRRLAHRVVWANPRKAAPGFAPVAAGMAAALLHVDDFVEGHSLAALEHLAAVVLGAVRAAPEVARA